MKRFVLQALPFLLLGAVINVAVAWVGLKRMSSPGTNHTVTINPLVWPCEVPADWPAPDDVFEIAEPWMTSIHASASEPPPQDDNGLAGLAAKVKRSFGVEEDWYGVIADVNRFGRPFRAIQMSFLTDVRRKNLTTPRRSGSFALPEWAAGWLGCAYAPYRVEPLGFAGNTLVFGSISYACLFGPAAVRRFLHRWCGRCAHCGYPIGVSPVCTECGRPVRPRAAPV